MKSIIKIFFVIIFLAASNLIAQDKEDLSKYPGFVDFSSLSHFMKTDKVTEIDLESYLLKMVSNITAKDEPELSQMLSGLKLIKVYSFDVDTKDAKDLLKKVDQLDNTLMGKSWNRIVKVKSPKENTNVYIKTSADQNEIVGLVVTSLQKNGQSSFINIVGKIDMDALGRLGEKFDIPSLEKVNKNK